MPGFSSFFSVRNVSIQIPGCSLVTRMAEVVDLRIDPGQLPLLRKLFFTLKNFHHCQGCPRKAYLTTMQTESSCSAVCQKSKDSWHFGQHLI